MKRAVVNRVAAEKYEQPTEPAYLDWLPVAPPKEPLSPRNWLAPLGKGSVDVF